jgi:hypothetical protein
MAFRSGTEAWAPPPPSRLRRRRSRGSPELGAGDRPTTRSLVLRIPIRETLAVLAGFSALAVFLTWPLVLHLGSHIYGSPGDPNFYMSWLWSLDHERGFHILGLSHVTTTGAPFGWDQGNGVNLQWAWVFVPAYLATKAFGEIAAYNLIILSGLTLSGAAMYWLVRALGAVRLNRLIAAWAGFVFVVFPWHVIKAGGHANLVHLEGFPLLLLACLAWFRYPSWKRGTAVGLATAVLWTTAGYYGLVGMVAAAVLLPIAAVSHRRRFGARKALVALALVLVGVIVVAGTAYELARLGHIDAGFYVPRSPTDLLAYGARPWEYLIPAATNQYFGAPAAGWLIAHVHGSNLSESTLYVGWLTILLAGGWLLWALTSRRRLSPERKFVAVGFAAVVAAGLLFSLPSPLPRTGVPMPSRLLWEVANQFRVPTRFQALIMAGLVPLAALGLAAIRGQAFLAFRSRQAARLAAAAVCVLFGMLSWFELSVVSPGLTAMNRPPAEYRALRSAPAGIVAEYPLVAADVARSYDYLFWQRVHHRRLLNDAAPGTFPDAVRELLVDPTSPGTPSVLAGLGVSTILVHPDTYLYTRPRPVPARLGAGYRLLARFADGTSMWRVVARRASALAAFRDGFGPPETPPGWQTSRWLLDRQGTIELYAREPGLYRTRARIFSYGEPRAVVLRGATGSRRLEASPLPAQIPLLLRLPAGYSTLTVETRPGPKPIPDGRSVSVYWSNWQLTPAKGSPGSTVLESRPAAS